MSGSILTFRGDVSFAGEKPDGTADIIQLDASTGAITIFNGKAPGTAAWQAAKGEAAKAEAFKRMVDWDGDGTADTIIGFGQSQHAEPGFQVELSMNFADVRQKYGTRTFGPQHNHAGGWQHMDINGDSQNDDVRDRSAEGKPAVAVVVASKN